MKKLFGLLSLLGVLCVGLVSSCSEEKEIVKINPDPINSAQYQVYFKGSAIKYFNRVVAVVENPFTSELEKCMYTKTDSSFSFTKIFDSIPDNFTQDSLRMASLFWLDSLPSVETDLIYGYGASVYADGGFSLSAIDMECRGIRPGQDFMGLMGVIAEELLVNIDSIPGGYVFLLPQ